MYLFFMLKHLFCFLERDFDVELYFIALQFVEMIQHDEIYMQQLRLQCVFIS